MGIQRFFQTRGRTAVDVAARILQAPRLLVFFALRFPQIVLHMTTHPLMNHTRSLIFVKGPLDLGNCFIRAQPAITTMLECQATTGQPAGALSGHTLPITRPRVMSAQLTPMNASTRSTLIKFAWPKLTKTQALSKTKRYGTAVFHICTWRRARLQGRAQNIMKNLSSSAAASTSRMCPGTSL
eukprot:SAG31_NODE_579_length_13948_cov_5.599105_10_plen_183_part_00